MLDLIEALADDQQELEWGLQHAAVSLRAGRVLDARGLVSQVESEVFADPVKCLQGSPGEPAELVTTRGRWQAGRLEILDLGTLRALAAARSSATSGRPSYRLWVLEGRSAPSDIGALQAAAADGQLFQVASQFNCLESPHERIVPIADYFMDRTQGPRASISAFPGAFLRHYAAPGPSGARFTQTSPGPQLNLLSAVCSPGVAEVRGGYLRFDTIPDTGEFARRLTEHLDRICVGLHRGIEVVFGHDWAGEVPRTPAPRISQVFTSTLAAGGYSRVDWDAPECARICRQLQRAAYLGTLLAAAATGAQRVVLTMIGGGAFDNPYPVIWEAIQWALEESRPFLQGVTTVVLNGRGITANLPMEELLGACRSSQGGLIVCDDSAFRVVR